MSAAVYFSRFALPAPPLPSLKRTLPFTINLASALPHSFSSTTSCLPTVFGHPKSSRCMASGVSNEDVSAPKSVPVTEAHELLKAGHRYLDVRTKDEFNGGHAVGAVNIPYMFKSGAGMSKNPNFIDEVSSSFNKDDKIVVGCLSGKRSFMAASELLKAGFTSIIDIAGGYSAWVQNRLPTE